MQPLDDRTYEAAKSIRDFVKIVPYSLSNKEDLRQLVRSSGSVAANYIEANESLSKQDFYYRLKVCRKEAKESILWLKLLSLQDQAQEAFRGKFIQEYSEFVKIFTAIISQQR